MTIEEELYEAAKSANHADNGEPITTDGTFESAFVLGADWVYDNSPLLRDIRLGDVLVVDKGWLERHEKNIKKEVIASACEWIMVTPMYNKQPTQLVEEFKQAMEKQI